jgi:hypothetical protein
MKLSACSVKAIATTFSHARARPFPRKFPPSSCGRLRQAVDSSRAPSRPPPANPTPCIQHTSPSPGSRLAPTCGGSGDLKSGRGRHFVHCTARRRPLLGCRHLLRTTSAQSHAWRHDLVTIFGRAPANSAQPPAAPPSSGVHRQRAFRSISTRRPRKVQGIFRCCPCDAQQDGDGLKDGGVSPLCRLCSGCCTRTVDLFHRHRKR